LATFSLSPAIDSSPLSEALSAPTAALTSAQMPSPCVISSSRVSAVGSSTVGVAVV
jgi:hypothetical protein